MIVILQTNKKINQQNKQQNKQHNINYVSKVNFGSIWILQCMIKDLLRFVLLVKQQQLMVGVIGGQILLISHARKPREGKETKVPQSLPRVQSCYLQRGHSIPFLKCPTLSQQHLLMKRSSKILMKASIIKTTADYNMSMLIGSSILSQPYLQKGIIISQTSTVQRSLTTDTS